MPDWLELVFEQLNGAFGAHWQVISTLLLVGLFAGATLGRFVGKREAKLELQALRAERDTAVRLREVEEGNSRRLEQERAEKAVKLEAAERLLGEKEIQIAQARQERDRAVSHAQEADQNVSKLRSIFADDVWRNNWSDRRADDGGAEKAFGPSPFPIIAVGNLKGGVGKTTIAGNLGAFLAARANSSDSLKPVLLIDLDFQGSLSATMLYESGQAAETQAPGEIDFRVKALFRGDLGAGDKLSMARSFARSTINRSSFYDCDYPAFRLEDELLYHWVLESGPKPDVRLRLAEFLYSPEVRQRFGAVILDLPPRTTTFSINALCAATDLIIPARTDELALKAIPRFVGQLKTYREQLWPHLRVSGVVGTMTQLFEPSETEKAALARAIAEAEAIWDAPQPPICNLGTIPAKASISANAGQQFQYFITNDGGRYPPHEIFKSFGERVLPSLSRMPA